jgi:hypothetical protein
MLIIKTELTKLCVDVYNVLCTSVYYVHSQKVGLTTNHTGNPQVQSACYNARTFKAETQKTLSTQ